MLERCLWDRELAYRRAAIRLQGVNSWLWILCPQCYIGAHTLNLRAWIPLLGQLTIPTQQCFVVCPVVLCKHVEDPAHANPFGDSSVEVFNIQDRIDSTKGYFADILYTWWTIFFFILYLWKLFHLLFWTLVK